MNGPRTQDERAVSPIIGVALLVAMTVILAAVLAMAALGLNEGMTEAPQVRLDFDTDGSDLVLTHEGGDPLDGEAVGVIVDGGDWTPLGSNLTAGEAYTLTGEGDATTVKVVWQDPQSVSRSVIATYTA